MALITFLLGQDVQLATDGAVLASGTYFCFTNPVVVSGSIPAGMSTARYPDPPGFLGYSWPAVIGVPSAQGHYSATLQIDGGPEGSTPPTFLSAEWLITTNATVGSVSPSSGSTLGGMPVTITGTGFAGTPVVTFGGTAATSVIVVNSTTLTCVTPAHAAGAVTVAVDSGTLPNGFTFIAPPVFTSVTPSSGTFCGGAAFTITGTGFYGTPTVRFDGVAATSIVVVSPTSITGVTPQGIGGAADIVITNPDGQVTTATDAFTYTCGCRNAQSATTLIYSALRLCREGLTRPGRTASTEELADGFTRLNDMLNAWGVERLTMYRVLRTTRALAASTASYTIGSGGAIDIVRPDKIEAAGLILDVNAVPVYEKPIDVITDQRWRRIQQKDLENPLAQGVYFDHGWSAGLGRVYLWPIPSVGTTTLVLYSLVALTAFADLTTCYTFPPGYGEAIRYQLALRLARDFGGLKDPETTTFLATTALARVKRGNIRPEEAALDPRTPGRCGWRIA